MLKMHILSVILNMHILLRWLQDKCPENVTTWAKTAPVILYLSLNFPLQMKVCIPTPCFTLLCFALLCLTLLCLAFININSSLPYNNLNIKP